MAVEHYENFPVASWLCPQRLRPAVTAIYWYARTADDLADEGDAPADARLAALAAYRADLEATAQQRPTSGRWTAVFSPLGQVIEKHVLPLPLLRDLLSAFEQDVANPRYTTRAELLDYCQRSANPIGRLLLHLYGVNDAAALRQSDAVCSALQLINFWQDLSVDLPRGRLYVPLQDCAAHGLTAERLLAGEDCAATRRLIADLTAWSSSLMHAGAPLVHALPGRIGWELRLVVQGGLAILSNLARRGHDAMIHRPALGPLDAPALAWRALRM